MPAIRPSTTSGAPSDVSAYETWLSQRPDVLAFGSARTHYDAVAAKMKSDFEGSILWKTITAELADYDSEYRISTGYPLLESSIEPVLQVKSYESFLEKTFRINVLNNRRWPSAPSGGWLLPPSWHSRINDVVRSMMVVKYLDGVTFLAEKLSAAARLSTSGCDVVLEARDEGYYAAHIYIKRTVEVPTLTWATENIPAIVELQVTTQLQEVIRKLTHTYYEKRRMRAFDSSQIKWQWDYKSEEFVPNYLGHILHYVEGMIMEVRQKETEATR